VSVPPNRVDRSESQHRPRPPYASLGRRLRFEEWRCSFEDASHCYTAARSCDVRPSLVLSKVCSRAVTQTRSELDHSPQPRRRSARTNPPGWAGLREQPSQRVQTRAQRERKTDGHHCRYRRQAHNDLSGVRIPKCWSVCGLCPNLCSRPRRSGNEHHRSCGRLRSSWLVLTTTCLTVSRPG